MPWNPGDSVRFKRGLSEKQQRIWARIANSALEGGASESSAVRQASGSLRSGGIESAARRKLQKKLPKSSITGAHT
jgi:hypothetical protein